MPAAAVDLQKCTLPALAGIAPFSNIQEVQAIYQQAFRDPYGTSWTWYLFDRRASQLAALESLQNNWDGFGAEAPNPTAIRLAQYLLVVISERNFQQPAAILPSVEGGVGITFLHGRRRGSIEILNSGDMVAALYEGRDEPQVWEFREESASITDTVERLRVYMSA